MKSSFSVGNHGRLDVFPGSITPAELFPIMFLNLSLKWLKKDTLGTAPGWILLMALQRTRPFFKQETNSCSEGWYGKPKGPTIFSSHVAAWKRLWAAGIQKEESSVETSCSIGKIYIKGEKRSFWSEMADSSHRWREINQAKIWSELLNEKERWRRRRKGKEPNQLPRPFLMPGDRCETRVLMVPPFFFFFLPVFNLQRCNITRKNGKQGR